MTEKLIELSKEQLGFKPTSIKEVTSVDIFEDHIEIKFEV